jgi:predicted transposase YbfD/YdcC
LSGQDATSTQPVGNPAAAPCGGDGPEGLDGYRSLLECLQAVPEPRRRRGIRHRLAVVLAFAVAAVLAGADSVTAIGEWASEAPVSVRAALGARRDRRGRLVAPATVTFRRVLKRVDATALAAAFGTWLASQIGIDPAETVIALDGKTLRGARNGQGKAPHLLAAMICGARAVIAQRDVDHKTNEITQVKPLLDQTDISGALVTADALHVQRQTARWLVEDKGADYLFTAVKDNQPGLFAALDARTGRRHPSCTPPPTALTAETKPAPCRSCPPPKTASPTPPKRSSSNGPSATPPPATSAPPPQPSASPPRTPQRGATPTAIATAARGHWAIEALHHVRDVTMNEDAHRLRAGTAPAVMATLRNTATAALRLIGFTNTAQGRRWAARDATRPLAALNLTI